MPYVDVHLGTPRGFTTQTWLASDIANRYFGKKHRVWFSTKLDPQLNGSSSNPRILYEELERIVHTNDYNHARIEQLRARLSNWIWGSPLSNPTKVAVVNEIGRAPVRAFRPSIWSIKLSKIKIARLVSLGQFQDEYLIRNLRKGEFKVIAK